ncbi:MAG TPA: phage holin family protein [Verrucomicrobiae bacterium]
MASTSSSGAPPPAGVVDTIRSFMASWVAVVKTRVEILSVELEEQREWLEHLMLMAVAAGFLISLGLVMLTIFIVVLFWETDARLWVLGGFVLIYLGSGVGLWLALRAKIKNRPKLFASTSTELGKDYAALQPRTP